MNLELFIGKKKKVQEASSEKDKKRELMEDSSSDLEASVGTDESATTSLNSTSDTTTDVTAVSLKELNLDALRKIPKHDDFLRWLAEAVMTHPLFTHHEMYMRELLATGESSLKTIREVSTMLNVPEGFIMGMIIAMKMKDGDEAERQ